MAGDLIQWFAGVAGIVGGLASFRDAARFQRHTAPWTRRVLTGIGSLTLAAAFPLAIADSAWAPPLLMIGMVAVCWPGSFRRANPRDESAALRSERTTR